MTERGSISTIGLSTIQYVTESGDLFGQIKLFLPTRRRPAIDHSVNQFDWFTVTLCCSSCV
jgi:hypothetical protein